MARRSLLGALIVALATAWPACALAATAPAAAPQLATARFVSPALLVWTPGADPDNVSQTVLRAPGTCSDTDGPAVAVLTYQDNITSQHVAQPGDGVWCFSIRAADGTGDRDESPGRTVRIDTIAPTATVAVSRRAPGGVVRGTVRISGTSDDEFSGVAGSAFHVGPVGACATGPAVTASWNTTSVPNGTYDVCTVATDVAGNVGTASVTVVVANDVPAVPPVVAAPAVGTPAVATPAVVTSPGLLAPKAPSKLVLVLPKRKAGRVILRWSNPAGLDLDRVVVVFNRKRAPRGPDDGMVIYRGLGTTVPLALHAGQRANVALYAYARTGGVSAPARRVVSLAALLPLRPVTGSTVTAPPLLTWKPRSGAAYYNVQLFHKGKRILVGWPRQASYRLHKSTLRPGTYVWYVWPALKGQRTGARFADLIGRATFVYKVPSQ